MSFFRSLAAKGQWAVTLALALSSTCATGVLGSNLERAGVAPGAYIVEFANVDGANAPTFFDNLRANDIDATPRVILDHELFNGVSFKLEGSHDNGATLQTIESMTMVNKIWPVGLLYRPPAAYTSSIDLANAASTPLKKRDVDDYAPHVMGGVDKLHAQGYTGDGLFIGVVDSGVDYKHPLLGGGFGPGYKIVTGRNLIGDDFDGNNNRTPNNDPMDCTGHGTHVSGIIGANPSPLGFVGVVPNATMGMWRVIPCHGPSSDDVLMSGIHLAYEAGVDLISISIAGPSGWPENPVDITVQRIVEKGVPCIIAAGNQGWSGLFAASYPAEAIGATSVGNIESITEPILSFQATYSVNNGHAVQFGYAKGTEGSFGTASGPLYAPSLNPNDANDGCRPFPASTPDLSPHVVLMKWGGCSYERKIKNAVASGARRILFQYSSPNVPRFKGSKTDPKFPVGLVASTLGATWISELKAGAKITIDFDAPADPHVTIKANNINGGLMANRSAWGPTYEARLSTQVSAPGNDILSTWLLKEGGYAVESGTSLACPYISGVIALIKQIRGKKSLSPKALTSLVATTAAPVDFSDDSKPSGYSYLAPVVQQGGGLVNAFKAAYMTTLLDLDNIVLNDTSHFQAAHCVTISNTGSKAQTYVFANLVAATAFTLKDDIVPSAFPPFVVQNATSSATIRFEPSSLVVGPNSKGIVTLHFTPPAGLNATKIPVYSGFVGISGSNGDTLSLPYAGIASRLKDAVILNDPYLAASSSVDTPITTSNTAVFTLPGNCTKGNFTLPTFVYKLAMGSRIVRIDVVPQNPRCLPRIVGQQVLGSIANYPVFRQPRSYAGGGNDAYDKPTWDGKLADGSYAPAGNYSLMMRALRILGNEACDDDYDRHDTPYFEIQYAVNNTSS